MPGVQDHTLTHPVALNIFRSSGSPDSSPSILVREWQAAMQARNGDSTTHSAPGSSSGWTNLQVTGSEAALVYKHVVIKINNRLTRLTFHAQPCEQPIDLSHPQWACLSVQGHITKVVTLQENDYIYSLTQFNVILLACNVTGTGVKGTLSKQMRFSCPQMLILWGLMQKMPTRLSRLWAYTMPAVMAAGRAGGTVMVTISRDSMIMVLAGTWKGLSEGWHRQSGRANVSSQLCWQSHIQP